MNGDNIIAIPWYRKTINIMSMDDSAPLQLPGSNQPSPKPSRSNLATNGRPVIETSPETTFQPGTVPVTVPGTIPEGGFIPDFPGIPVPRLPGIPEYPGIPGFPGYPRFPGAGQQPAPQPQYTETEQRWVDNFVQTMSIITTLSGIEARRVYNFVQEYDFDNNGLGDFRSDAAKEFDAVTATLLVVAMGISQLAQLWGKRAAAGFTPPINLDDEFFQRYFGGKELV